MTGSRQEARRCERHSLLLPLGLRPGAAARATGRRTRPSAWKTHLRIRLLSPFDRLIQDRVRTQRIFGFRIPLPAGDVRFARQREFGYYVLPVVHGDRLVGRVDALYDRRAGVMTIDGVWAEPDAPTVAGGQIADSVSQLARWLGAARIDFGPKIDTRWHAALTAIG
jgi:uncharacterized protein YcaQ